MYFSLILLQLEVVELYLDARGAQPWDPLNNLSPSRDVAELESERLERDRVVEQLGEERAVQSDVDSEPPRRLRIEYRGARVQLEVGVRRRPHTHVRYEGDEVVERVCIETPRVLPKFGLVYRDSRDRRQPDYLRKQLVELAAAVVFDVEYVQLGEVRPMIHRERRHHDRVQGERLELGAQQGAPNVEWVDVRPRRVQSSCRRPLGLE